jgi:hypothetical protein
MNKKTTIISAFVLILSINLIIAGVGNPYVGRILTIEKGSTKVVNISLQNMLGEADYTMNAEITEGNDIAAFDRDSYFLKAKTSDTLAHLTITIPEDYTKTSGRIMMEFKEIKPGESGGLEQGISYGELIQLSIVEPPPKETPKIIPLILTILIIVIVGILLIILLLMRTRKK